MAKNHCAPAALAEVLESRVLLSVSALEVLPAPAVMLESAYSRQKLPSAKPVTDDYGNTFASAPTVSLAGGSAQLTGKINYAGDVDMFRLTTAADGTLTVHVTASGGKKAIDSTLTLYSGSGAVVATSNDPLSSNSLLTLNADAGEYYIAVGANGSRTGGYTVAVTAPTPPTPGPTPPAFLPAPDAYAATTTVFGTAISTAGGLVLVVTGTDGNDTITLSQNTGSITIATAVGSQYISGDFVGLALYGFAGQDVLRIAYSISLVSVVYAGAGNDSVFENSQGAGYIYGQDGDDLLVTVGGGSDVMTGAAGNDSFWLDGSDMLVDADAAETAAANVHKIAQFFQPVSDPAKFVSLEIADQDIVDPVASATYYNYASKPLFVDGPQYNDIRQGSVGDCYYLAALASFADSDPALLMQMIAPLGDGSYAVRFYRSGSEYYVRVDSQLPGSATTPTYAKITPDGELWVALAEKAYAQFRTGQNSYTSISGGWMDDVYREITGKNASWLALSNYSDSALADLISSNLTAGHAVSAGSFSSATTPIIGSHAYAIRDVQSISDVWYVTVYNPWGYDGVSWDSVSSDGLLTISLAIFRSNYSAICVSQA